jgi:hypothetical protein
MADEAPAFAKLVPGFDFLQGLVKNAGAAMPNIGQWVAPTLDPEELEKRIGELKTVQFWLEQNARMLGATIQALEVQRMTLSTLKTMNVQMGDLRDSLQIRMADLAGGMKPRGAGSPAAANGASAGDGDAGDGIDSDTDSGAASEASARAPSKTAASKSSADAGAKPAGPVDPLQWWSALTQQFTQLAASAIQETATDAATRVAGRALKQSIDGAGRAPEKAVTGRTEPAAKAKPARKRSAAARSAK